MDFFIIIYYESWFPSCVQASTKSIFISKTVKIKVVLLYKKISKKKKSSTVSSFPFSLSALPRMLIPKKDRLVIYEALFRGSFFSSPFSSFFLSGHFFFSQKMGFFGVFFVVVVTLPIEVTLLSW